MALTYVPAAARDERRARVSARVPGVGPLTVGTISLLSVLVVGAASIGRTVASERAAPGATVNLNTVTEPAALEPALAAAFEQRGDRAFAARELFGLLVQADGGRRVLPNVGSIARFEVPVAAIEKDTRLTVYRERLLAGRERAASGGRPLERVPLFTPGDVSAVKPALVVRTSREFRRSVLVWSVLIVAAFQMVWVVWRARAVGGDHVLLAVAHLLTIIGFAAMLGRSDPLRDTMLFVRFAQATVLGACVMAAASLVDTRKIGLGEFSFLPLVAACALSMALLVFGSGPAGSNAKVNLGPIQPIEAIRLLLVLFLAGYFARRWELLRAVRGERVRGRAIPAWLNAPRLDYVLPVLAGVGAALALFFFQRDLGPALIIAVLFLTLYVVARAKVLMALGGAALLACGFYVGYTLRISATLAERVRMWQSPWDNAARGGDQISHALWSMSTGGASGTGLGLGDTRYLPAGHTDLILAAIGEELGLVGILVVAALYVTLIWRGLHIARRAGTDYAFFLALALTLTIALPVLLMMSGILGLVPLTGVVTPFLSYGGSAMLANFLALGVLAGLRSRREAPAADLLPFGRPVRWVGGALALFAAVLVAFAVRVQVLQADELLVRPHLGMQADGTRRYQYNPRVLDVARQIPRGHVLDRRGIPLATDDPALLKRAQNDLQRLGVVLDEVCRDSTARCYPLGGRTYHLLGDARTRTDWSASNTSFVERDAESRLRGFDDRQTSVRTIDASGGAVWTLRRDYRDLVPLVRHRHDPDHASVKALLGASRDLTLTIDAALQARTAAIVADYAKRSASGRAAAVVIDPQSGDLLAAVSYPWPASLEAGATDEHSRDALLDRARYGLYPPGSTFKLVTAAAALRRDGAAHRERFVCSRLPDGRVGAKISGWGRPVRDDVLDHTPHGSLDMHRAMVVSCNAYFAQLAVRLGPQALLDTASRVEVSLARGNAPARVRDALPQVGYGQAEVVATPVRMARIAAAVANGGIIREVRWDASAARSPGQPFVAAETARLLGSYMRDVVLQGTGRSIRNSPHAIAGKTGTAEIAGAPSHSWFVGFAPYGQATRRVAVAVILENAGYGGAGAAPAAAEIVAAAAAVGLVR